MSDPYEEPLDEVFENPGSNSVNSNLLFLGALGLIVFAIVGFMAAMAVKHDQLSIHMTTTAPTLVAIGLLARGFSLRHMPRRIVIGVDGIEITTKHSKKKYPWSEIGAASTANVLNSQKMCLCITDTLGKTIIRVDESFPGYERLVELVQSHVDAKPDDTSLRILSRKWKQSGLVCFGVGGLLGVAAVFIAMMTRAEQRARELLPVKGVPGDAEIVRRFVAPNGSTKRLEYRIAGSGVKNVEVQDDYWAELSNARTVPVIFVPDEPDINRLVQGEVKDGDVTKTPTGGYLLSLGAGLMSLIFLGFTPFAWMGYDLAFDDKKRSWNVKQYGRVIWTSRKEAVEDADSR